jgi:hypothetical protein
MTTTKGKISDGSGIAPMPTPGETQFNKRDVWDKIIMNYAQSAPSCLLLSKGTPDENGWTQQEGLLRKRKVDQVRYEVYNYNPLVFTAKVTAALSSTTLYCNTENIKYADTVHNTRNKTWARVDSVTSATECVITSFGATAFSVEAGDVLMIGSTAYGQNSNNPSMISNDMDHIFNTVQISREPVAESETMRAIDFYGTTDYFALRRKINFGNFFSKAETAILFGAKASSGNTTSGGSSLTTAFSTTNGIYTMAANSYDMDGQMTMYKLQTELPIKLDTVHPNDKMIAYAGQRTIGNLISMIQGTSSVQITGKESVLDVAGLNTTKIRTNKFILEFVHHPLFDVGSYATEAFVFKPEMNGIAYLRDFQPLEDRQENDRDGRITEILGEFGADNYDGGQSSCILTNLW